MLRRRVRIELLNVAVARCWSDVCYTLPCFALSRKRPTDRTAHTLPSNHSRWDCVSPAETQRWLLTGCSPVYLPHDYALCMTGIQEPISPSSPALNGKPLHRSGECKYLRFPHLPALAMLRIRQSGNKNIHHILYPQTQQRRHEESRRCRKLDTQKSNIRDGKARHSKKLRRIR